MGEWGPIAIAKVRSGYFITLPHFAGNCAITIITLARAHELSLFISTLPIMRGYIIHPLLIIVVELVGIYVTDTSVSYLFLPPGPRTMARDIVWVRIIQ